MWMRAVSWLLWFLSAIPSFPCSNGGLTLDLIHRDSPLSPFQDASATPFHRLRTSIHRSFSRHSSLTSEQSIASNLTYDGLEYVMNFSIGTPPVHVFPFFDTASDLTWIQCRPCRRCYLQSSDRFDPAKSSSYEIVPCSARQCRGLGNGKTGCSDSNGCLYSSTYGDGSYSYGDLSMETFTFYLQENVVSSFTKVLFGCGHDNAWNFNEHSSGIVGLGGGDMSIVQQMAGSVAGKFSYCLTSPESKSPGKMRFGRDTAIGLGNKTVSTPIVKKTNATLYHLTLQAVSVGDNRIDFIGPESEEAVEEGNIVIDTGSRLTFLPREFYNRVETALVNAVIGKRVADPQRNLALCYESLGEMKLPVITAHFTAADVVLRNTFVKVTEEIVCLTIAPSDALVLFGSLHQVGYVVLFELDKLTVSFSPTGCGDS